MILLTQSVCNETSQYPNGKGNSFAIISIEEGLYSVLSLEPGDKTIFFLFYEWQFKCIIIVL